MENLLVSLFFAREPNWSSSIGRGIGLKETGLPERGNQAIFHSKESNLPETPSDPGAFAAEPSCYLYLLGRDPEFLGSPLL